MDTQFISVTITCPNWKSPGAEDCGTVAEKLKDEGPVPLAAWPKSNPALDFFSVG